MRPSEVLRRARKGMEEEDRAWESYFYEDCQQIGVGMQTAFRHGFRLALDRAIALAEDED